MLAEREQGRAYPYPYLIEIDGRLAGRVTVTNVARGPFCSVSLGYWVASVRTGRGVATRAVEHVLTDCFTVHGLHRLETATLVDNLASQAVLRHPGFTLIGHAPGYRRIAGALRTGPWSRGLRSQGARLLTSAYNAGPHETVRACVACCPAR